MNLNAKETALILAGLRTLQEQMVNGGTRDLSAGVLETLDDADIAEGGIDDIDSLCVKVNTDDSAERALNIIATLRARLAGWMEIADEEDERELDQIALDEADDFLLEAGRTP
ncbi:hypothetical protein [Massilia sp. TN1-12]|uniref:hypothetical protein n=1 Tax=Massilia paldalensis TaxID=3377675 RepID=UPI00384F6A3D